MEYETCDICDKQLSINKCEDFFIEDENGAHVFCEKHWVEYQKKERKNEISRKVQLQRIRCLLC